MLTDYIAFDEAVKVALDFAKRAPGNDTLVVVAPDHNTGGLTIGNYRHRYPNVTVEALVDPFLGMTTTCDGLVAKLPPAGDRRTTQSVIDTVRRYWNLTITAEDVREITSHVDRAGQPASYEGQLGPDKLLSFAMCRILTEKYTYAGWTSHGHSGGTSKWRK